MYANPLLFPQVTNRESWEPTFALFDDDTGAPITITGAAIVLEVRPAGPSQSQGWWGNFYDPVSDQAAPILSAAVGNGITITGTNTFSVAFTAAQMRTLCPGTYNVGCTLTLAGDTRQLFLGRLPVFAGMVS